MENLFFSNNKLNILILNVRLLIIDSVMIFKTGVEKLFFYFFIFFFRTFI